MTTALDWSQLIEPPLPDPLELFRDLPITETGDRWDLDQSPWVRGVFEWWLDPQVEWVYLIQGSQTSKTTTMMGLALYAAEYDPAPAMWVGAIEDEVDKFVVQRLKPFLTIAAPAARTRRKTDWRKSDLRLFGRMLIHFAWATSSKKLRSWGCRYVFGDECGVWPASLPEIGDPLDYVKKRCRRYKNRKGIFATTPSADHHPAWRAAKDANFARWFVPCPECGEYQYLDFARVRFDHCRTDDKWNLERVANETYYECEACGARLTDVHKPAMIAAGKLVYVDPDTNEPTEPDAGNRSRTLQVPATYSLFTTWGAVAKMFLEAKAKGPDNLRIWTTDEIAQPWVETVDAPTPHAIAACIDPERAPGTVPEGTLAITAGVDVHKDRLYYCIRAWGKDGRSWLIQHGILPRDTAGDRSLDILDDVLTVDYGGRPIAFTFIDSGWEPDYVYAYCRGRRNVAPSKGAAGAMGELVKPHAVERHRGKPIVGGLVLHMIHTTYWKGWIHSHIQVKRGDPGEWRLHGETDRAYMRQILAEARVETTRRGQIVREWIIVDKSAGNHFLDSEVLCAAASWYPVAVQRLRPPRPRQTPSRSTVAKPRPPIRRSY